MGDEGSSEFLFNESIEYADSFSAQVIKATEFIANLTLRESSGVSENIKLLAPLSNSSASGHGNFSLDHNSTINSFEPHIPDIVRTTSIAIVIIILCLGLIGNIMVNKLVAH